MALPAEKLPTLEALRTRIAERFRGTVPESPSAPRGPALESGWQAVDRSIALHPGGAVTLQASPGGGALALASAWARAASRQGEPVMVIDATDACLPHPWVEPPEGRAPIWVVAPPHPPDAWPATDIALRSGAFGLVILLDPPDPPRGTGPRLTHLVRTRHTRFVVHDGSGRVVLPSSPRVHLRAGAVHWREAPVGAAPHHRALMVSTGPSHPSSFIEVERDDDDVLTDRLRPSPRAPDRRPPYGNGRSRHDG